MVDEIAHDGTALGIALAAAFKAGMAVGPSRDMERMKPADTQDDGTPADAGEGEG